MSRPATLPRSLLQLVRYARSPTARAEIHIHCRQRQFGRTSDRARQRVRGVEGSPPRRGAALQRRRRCARNHPRGMRPLARRPPDPDRDPASARRSARPSSLGFATGRAFESRLRRSSPAFAPRPRSWSTSPARSRSNEATEPSADTLFWACAVLSSIDAHGEDLAQSAETRRRSSGERLIVLGSKARSMALAMDFGFLLDPDRQLLSIGYLVNEGVLDLELLRSPGVRGAARQFLRDRQRRRRRPSTGSSSAAPRRRSPTAPR